MHQTDRRAVLPILVYLRGKKLRDTMVKGFERSNQLPGLIIPYPKTLITYPYETRTVLNPKSPKSLVIFLPEFQPKTPKTPEIQRQTGLPSLVVTLKCTKQTDMQVYPFWLSSLGKKIAKFCGQVIRDSQGALNPKISKNPSHLST